ncbi:hypothetical protein CFL01nite_15990 [Corynebacterium flavescens]|uniref:Uncharacterized protein n=1 Tax=Corynebacterium flavescens TaxID=28028 RepID=A0AB73B8A1_CORFL|nr:hypothetical protein CFL01nite_15990 [Corynebacterium flavescens]
MPMPAMSQPMSMAPGPATEAMFWGMEKIPAPTVEPIMRATSVHILTVWDFFPSGEVLEVIRIKYPVRDAAGPIRLYS